MQYFKFTTLGNVVNQLASKLVTLRLSIAKALLLMMLMIASTAAQSADAIVVNASGTPIRNCSGSPLVCSDTFPNMSIYINGVLLVTTTVTAVATNYVYSTTLPTSGALKVDVFLGNDGYCSNAASNTAGCTGDINLDINSVSIGNQIVNPTDAGVIVDIGASYSQATDGADIGTYNNFLVYNSALRINTSYAQCCSPKPIANYRMEEAQWSGNTGEVIDSIGNSYHGAAAKKSGTTLPTTANTSPAIAGTTGTCGYGVFNRTQYINIPTTFPNITNALTLSAWIKTTDITTSQRIFGDDQNTNGGGGYGLSLGDAGSGALRFYKRNNVTGQNSFIDTGNVIANNTWYFVAASMSNTSGTVYVYNTAGTQLAKVTGAINASYAALSDPGTASIGGPNQLSVENFGFIGNIDEVTIHSGELSEAEINALRLKVHACSSTPNLLANYRFEELTWTTSAGQVIDASGNGYHASVAKVSESDRAKPEDALANRFIAGDPGTCGYAIYGGGSASFGPIVLPSSLPNLTGSFTFATWFTSLSTIATAYRIFADDFNGAGGFVFSLNDGGSGKLRFAKRAASGGGVTILDTPAVISAGTDSKYFIAVSVNAASETATIYVYDTNGTLLSQTTGVVSNFGGSDPGNMTIGGVQSPSGNQFLLHGRTDEVSIYNGALSQAQILALLQAKHACPIFNAAAANFNCVVTGGSSDTGRLYTQLSNTSFNVDVVALKADRTTETSFVTSGTKNVTVDWMSNANNTCTAGTVLTPSSTATFSTTDNGRKTVSVSAFNKAYRDLRCRVTDTNQSPSVIGCSSDNFSVRPPGFTISSSNAIADGANSNTTRNENATPTFIAASSNFSLTAATGVAGYDGTPIVRTPAGTNNEDVYSWAVGASPLIGDSYSNPTAFYRAVGNVTGNFAAANPASGNATGTSFKYSEVGYFRFQENSIIDSNFTSVDQPSDCNLGYNAGDGKNACIIGHVGRTVFFGRFIPDRFRVTPITTTPACNSAFTYFGQDGLTSNFKVEALNALGQITQNYTNNAENSGELYGKLDLINPTNFFFSASSGTIESSSITTVGNWVRGEATITAKHKISRPSTAMAPTSITFSAKPVDSDGVTVPAAVAVSSASNFRYGRLFMHNTYGSELLPLSVPIEAQYWNGTAYQRNQLDVCTAIPTSSVAMGNYKANLGACETALAGGATMANGKVMVKLSAPGNGNNGSVDLSVNLNSASGSTCTPSAISATSAAIPWFGATPSARATFGLFKSPVIYMRESY